LIDYQISPTILTSRPEEGKVTLGFVTVCEDVGLDRQSTCRWSHEGR